MAAPLILPAEKWEFVRDTYTLARADLNDADQDCDEEIQFYSRADQSALKAMMLAPAPDAEALRFKLEVFRDEGCVDLRHSLTYAMLSAMIADAKRLAGGQMAEAP